MHSGKAQKHSGKPSLGATLGEELPGILITVKRPSPSAKCTRGMLKTLGEELPGMLLTVKRPSLSAKSHTLGEGFPKCRASSRRRFNTVGAIHFPECNTRGRLFFFKKTLLRVQHSGNFFLKKNSSPRGRNSIFFKRIFFSE
jgi:hypothetical protein